MRFSEISPETMANYVSRQLDHVFPDGTTEHHGVIAAHVKAALERTYICINAVKIWRAGEFDVLQTSQYATFLYCLANEIWVGAHETRVCAKLFGLNKALNGIDLFYEIMMPSKFLLGHSTGIVLAKATYGEYLVLHQNCTVGRRHDRIPVLGEGVVMFPNSAIIGNCHVGDNTALSFGAALLDHASPGGCVIMGGTAGKPTVRASDRRYADDYFRFGGG
jgi:serine O-acetyltransferase